jgi:thiol-disulfide isomerase/thioredoxin
MKKNSYLAIAIVLVTLWLTACSAKESTARALSFSTNTLNGEAVSSDVFSGYKLTMVNIWTTWCSSCIKEMPELKKVYEKLKDENVNIIGIIADTPGKDQEASAKRIVEETGLPYDNLIPDQNLKDSLLKKISAYPTTVFVDPEGNIIGITLVGENTAEGYYENVQKILNNQ